MSKLSTQLGPIPLFLDKMSKSWDFSLAYSKIWAIRFYGCKNSNSLATNDIFESIRTVINNYGNIHKFELNDKNPYRFIYGSDSQVDKITFDLTEQKYFLLANRISLPDDSVSILQQNYPTSIVNNGMVSPVVVGGIVNTADKTVNISFLETNRDILDYLIKPWITAISHQGLIVDPSLPCLKVNIVADFYAKNSDDYTASTPILRKSIIFKDCFPIKANNKNYDYAPTMGNETIIDVPFAYGNYEITLY